MSMQMTIEGLTVLITEIEKKVDALAEKVDDLSAKMDVFQGKAMSDLLTKQAIQDYQLGQVKGMIRWCMGMVVTSIFGGLVALIVWLIQRF